jgi:hypothetical protein
MRTKVCQWLATGRWFSQGPPVSSTNKTDRHDITKIVLKVVLNTIKQTNTIKFSYISMNITIKFLYITMDITIKFSYITMNITTLSQVTDKLYHIILCTSPWSRFELTTSVVIGTDCRGIYKSNYHTITATTATHIHGHIWRAMRGNVTENKPIGNSNELIYNKSLYI